MTPSADGIDHSGSRAVLIGVSSYRDPAFPPIEGAEKSLLGVQRMLVDEELGGWPYDRVTPMLDPVDSRRVISTLRRLAQGTSGVLLLYFVGHGTITAGGDLALAVTDTVADEPDVTGLEYSKIRGALLGSPATVKAVVLDCCYSGRAINALAGDGQYLADATDIRGTYTLTAADHVAHAGGPGACTAFTGELLDLIGTGIADGPPVLTFAELYPHLRHRLIARDLPQPNQRGTDTADRCPLAKNAHGTATATTASTGQPPTSQAHDEHPRTASPTPGAAERKTSRVEAADPAPFEMTWTGTEPVSSYTQRTFQVSSRTLATWSKVFAVATVASIPLGVLRLGFFALSGLLLLVVVYFAVYSGWEKGLTERSETRRGWSLHVGPNYIMTTDATGRRERIWAQIQRVTIEEIQGQGPYQHTGIHIEYTKSSRPRATPLPAPAGWPYPRDYFLHRSFKSRGWRIPVCVLGPMTDGQRDELIEALARYGGQRWEGSLA